MNFLAKIIIEMERINLVVLLSFHFSLHLGQIWQISRYQHPPHWERSSLSVPTSWSSNISRQDRQRRSSHQEWVSNLFFKIFNLCILHTFWSWRDIKEENCRMNLIFWNPTLQWRENCCVWQSWRARPSWAWLISKTSSEQPHTSSL